MGRDSKKDRERLVLERGRKVFCLLNLYPYNNGHLMIAPYRHLSSVSRMSAAEAAETFSMLRKYLSRLERAFRPDGFNIGYNVGRVAGAGFHRHVHLHVVPRWEGDTNFMPVLSGDKVISDSLASAYRLLSGARSARGGGR